LPPAALTDVSRPVLTARPAATRWGYGERVVERLAARLAARSDKGFSVPSLRNMRQFFLIYPRGSGVPVELGGPRKRLAQRTSKIRSAPPSELRAGRRSAVPTDASLAASALFPQSLGWTHYTILMRIAAPSARAFYEIECVRESWSSRELERQVASLRFERLPSVRTIR